MSSVSTDWLEVEQRIEEARKNRAKELDLSFLNIESIPDSISQLDFVSSIDLSFCESLENLNELHKAINLERINLKGCKALKNLQPISSLKALRELNLCYCEVLVDIEPIVLLSNLQSLDLKGCEKIQHFGPLKALRQLRQLNLDECRSFNDIALLAPLGRLKELDLSRIDNICDISSLNLLSNLRKLNLGGCEGINLPPALSSLAKLSDLELSFCPHLTALPLGSLPVSLKNLNLTGCDALTDISALQPLVNLRELDLSQCYELVDFSPLKNLISLIELNLSQCERLGDISCLSALSRLHVLDLSDCSLCSDPSPLLSLSMLKRLKLPRSISLPCHPENSIISKAPGLIFVSSMSIEAAPREMASSWADENCIFRLKSWHNDLKKEQAKNQTIKLFIIGNGSAGKTQISRRLNGQEFDPSISSTHGIDLGKVTLIQANEDRPEIVAHVWDFGGQDIYHGTHALFMDERALFVIVWNPELEAAQPYTEHGVAMRHRPLAYWLAMVRDVAGEDAAVVVVQSKCDRQQDSVQPPLPAEHGLRYLRYTACSAKNQSGMSSLLTSIQDQAQLLLERYGQVLLPASWVAVGDTLRARCSEGLRTLPRAEFETLCRAHHASAPPEVVLHYLHRSGEVFYRPGLFGDQLILNQQWALKGVYAVLDRQCSLPLLRRLEGKFDQEILDELVWRGKYSSNEQALFISLMEQCGACFPVNQDWDYPKKTHYIAPDLLPERSEAQEKIDDKWRRVEAHLEVWLNYRFLHDGVMKALLCAIGRRAGVHAVYWRYGVCFFDQGMQASFLLEAQPDIDPQRPGAGRLVWQAHVVQENKMAEVQRWLEDLLSTVERNTQGQRPEVSWQRSQAHTPAQDRKASHHDDPIQRLQPGSQPDAKPTVYVSYGWGDANTELLAQLEAAFTLRDYQLIYDKKKMRTGDWISAFMREIGQSRHVLVLLDDKYLRSPYCMRELLYLYQSSLGDKAVFCRRIVPWLPESLLLSPVKHRLPYLRHWKEEAKSHQDLLDEFSLEELSPETRDEVLLVKDFCHRTDEMLAWIADIVMDRGAQALSADNFAAIFTALHNQGFPLPAATGSGQ